MQMICGRRNSYYQARKLNRGQMDRQETDRVKTKGPGPRVFHAERSRGAHVAHTSRMSITFGAIIIIDHPPPFRRTFRGLSANCRRGIDLPGAKS